MMRTWRGALFGALFLATTGAASAQPAEDPRPLLHPLFTDHAVLQRGKPIAVWGWAQPGERVTVSLGDASRNVRAARDGSWRVNLPARQAGGAPLTLTARAGSRSASANDLLVGDVYLCSGQSNMEFQTRYTTNAYTVLNEAGNENIRLFNVARVTGDTPHALPSSTDRWQTATRDAVADFSAVCYFFGRDIQNSQRIPIGLISPSWGGTVIEAWMSMEGLRNVGGLDAQLALVEENARDPAAARAAYARLMEQWWSQNDPGGRAGWNAVDFDASSWATINPGGFWENAGERPLAGFDGIAWYRTEFTLTAAQAAQGGRLTLGPADDIDASYVNGRALGSTVGWDTPRTYDVPAGALRAGRNVFASAVLDTGGGGGWWGPPAEKVLTLADGARVPLNNPWRYQISAPLHEVTTPPQAPWGGPNGYSVLYNGMIAPLAPYGLAGVLWYQGEANANAAADYARLMPGWMADWRTKFEARDLPFFVVQLANYGPPVIDRPQRGGWGEIRDVQRRVVAADPRAGLAVSVDIGDRFDIHPTQKLLVAERLALHARRMIYAEDVIATGPTPVSARVEQINRMVDTNPASAVVRSVRVRIVRVTFANGTLHAYSDSRPIAFELCNADRVCQFADATISGESVMLDVDAFAGTPAFVRYCWGDSPICNLYNAEDLPAVPFEIAVE